MHSLWQGAIYPYRPASTNPRAKVAQPASQVVRAATRAAGQVP